MLRRKWVVGGLAGLGLVVVVGGAWEFGLLPKADHGPTIGGPFRLTDQNGAAVDERVLRGSWSVIYFGYTFCPDACPTTLTSLAATQARLAAAHRSLRVVFISVDPARDTPAQLKAYLSSPAFPKETLGLTGSPAQVAAAARAYGVYFKQAGKGADYSVDHTSIIYLMDPEGRFSRPIGYGLSPDDMAAQINQAIAGR